MITVVEWDRLRSWNRDLALALVFGLASVPWTYGFVAELEIPLWPAFVGSAAVFAAGGGRSGFRRGLSSTLVGAGYAAATLAVVAGLDGGVVVLSVTVGAFMLLASLHAFVPSLSFVPGAFFGYAMLFSVDAAGASVAGLSGLAAVTAATGVALAIGAGIGFAADRASDRLVEEGQVSPQ